MKASDVVCRDARNRAQGWMAEFGAAFSPDRPTDRVLTERVRANLGRCVSHPAAIEVRSDQGNVTLTGPVLAEEVEQLVLNVRKVRGVTQVDNQLEVYDEPGTVSALQGGRRRTGRQLELFQTNLSPTMRATLGGAGIAFLTSCLVRGSGSAIVLGPLGLAMFAKSIANLPSDASPRRESGQNHKDFRQAQRESQRQEQRPPTPAGGQGRREHGEATTVTDTAVVHDL